MSESAGRLPAGNRLHRPLAAAVIGILESVFRDGIVADRAVAKALRSHPKWGARDRSFIAESVYETVRWKRRLEWLADSREIAALAAAHWQLSGFVWSEDMPWPVLEPDKLASRADSLALAPRAVRESVSDAFDELAGLALGGAWDRELAAMNQAGCIFLRVNPLRTTREAVAARLAEKSIVAEAVEGMPLALRLAPGSKAIAPSMLRDGDFEIQDAGSQMVAPFVLPAHGQRIVDACAGAGGKTLHLAALTAGKAEIFGLDITESRLSALRARAVAAGVNVRTGIANDATVLELSGTADRVLIDAPCSGSGTLRRQPDLKYRIEADFVREKCRLQRELLDRFSPMVRPGGMLIYATCSILPCENEDQASQFTSDHPDFTFDADHRVSPAITGTDGFYMARWIRHPGN